MNSLEVETKELTQETPKTRKIKLLIDPNGL